MENQKKKRSRREEEYVGIDCKYIPDDLLREIPFKLPARSICRFRCVCKSWRDLFEDEEFRNRTRAKPPFEFQVQKDIVVEYLNIDETGFMSSKGKIFCILGCRYRRCNNLICYQCDYNILSVLDMSTDQIYFIPHPPFETYNFEFGFDLRSRQYKVLLWRDASSTRPRPKPDFCILDLDGQGRTGSSSLWKTPWLIHVSSSRSSFFEKPFATTAGMFYLFNAVSHQLISYNLATERFRIIQLPHQVLQRRKMNQSDFWYQLFEYQGCLCWVEQSVTGKTFSEMDWEITGMWMLKDNVDVDDIKWVRLIKELPLPFPMPAVEATSASITWSRKHSHFSSTRSGEIIITVPCTRFGDDPCLLLYNFLDCQFRTIQLSMNWGDHFCGLDNNESCSELL